MEKEISSWKIFLVFLVCMGLLSLFSFKDNLHYYFNNYLKKEQTDKNIKSKESTNIAEKIIGTKLLKCKKENINTETGDKETDSITITYRNNNLEVYESEQITESKENVDLSFELLKALTEAFSQLEGVQMNTVKLSDTSYKMYTKIVYKELNYEQLAKLSDESETNKHIAESDMFKKTKIKMDEYKKELEKEYICE